MSRRSQMQLPISAILALAASACGQGKSSDRPARAPAADETGFALRGMDGTVWESSCISSADKKESARIMWSIFDRTLDKLTSYFYGADCAGTELYAQRGASYEHIRVSDHSAHFADSSRVKGRLVSVTFAPLRDDFTATMNGTSVYGKADWMTGRFIDVTGLAWDKDSQAEHKKGKALALVYKIEGEVMYFAYNKSDGSYYYETDEPFTRK